VNGNLACVSPETVGISSKDIIEFVEALENSGTEMHGMMILRHGKIAAGGWWTPYAPSIIHGSQSLTKTVTGTAYGIAELEGILSKEELVVDIFPEFKQYTKGPYWDELKVFHMLTMSSGMEKMPAVTDAEWIRKFFTMEIVHKPGTAFFYNSVACSMVAASIVKKTGMGIREFLKPRLFDKIGINADAIKWYKHPDGHENCSGGIVTTTEDNARLMQLYLQEGMWNGEQIVSRDWVNIATKTLNPNFTEDSPNAKHDQSYGGMMWIKGEAFYADGAMGQFAVGFPSQDMVISLNQTISSGEANEKVRNLMFGFAQKVKEGTLPSDEVGYRELQNKLKNLAIKAATVSSVSVDTERYQGRKCLIQSGRVVLFAEDIIIFNPEYTEEVYSFSFYFEKNMLKLVVVSEYGIQTVYVGLQGDRIINTLKSKRNPATEVALNAWWTDSDADTMMLEIRWLESCRLRHIQFTFHETEVSMISTLVPVGGFDVSQIEAHAYWVDE
jgi:CubicO group peptidase (beta-lactamase class C family)